MFQLFSRARSGGTFRARSAGRDAETDGGRIASIVQAIDGAVGAAETEWSGLNTRIDDVLARAAVTLGNDSDEYLHREPLDTHHQNLFDQEIANGQRRLDELSHSIKHFKFVKAALLSRFPNFRMPATPAN
ncbi:hypothetical protein JQ557_31195 [Bradyrhizobium sp. U87765 SZCCT0131]|uniref:hypothetical protein n=1 Tax=unclassified Bradyrhizobium TaxID=2631580 RepID=UPI001BA9700A|nr:MULTISPECIES: hypothetical protein [unclassified Bradyrhizobium]MBR1222500.1 hypothetical protein [Bradyrhizobium sp. U87765 SZCCT0131]MBR1265419.1 hypothetical protein [Bradyrhizobium sp. U87765 SZCCT0134]MBR1302802.1 hypothetical protein [Bradyrhizobium sp. U87765 SZCCT0110]MBR1323500.1 hypothetical protein [Bradyrhizobium sp. U87765 SZCCT0109]MBR1346731.1 hypothetical protein [Bradyrhizobium sp. U87765 SZCCT0048]